jgi:hypothetical protein
MSSYAVTASDSFTLTHARYIASKVAADLVRFQDLYGQPGDEWIDKYESELTILLKYDAVDEVVYGFKRNGLWTMASARYVALPGGSIQADSDPGKIRPGVDVAGAAFTSFLTYSARWSALPFSDKERIRGELPFQRSTSSTPGLEQGYWAQDHNYMAGGRGIGRSTVRI